MKQNSAHPSKPDGRGLPADGLVGRRFNPYRVFNGLFVPEAVARYRGISPGAKLVYGRLCRYAGENGDAHPSIGALSVEVGVSETQTRQYLRELIRERFLESEYRVEADGRQTSNRYFFVWHPAFDGAIGEARKTLIPGVQKPAGGRVQISAGGRVRKTAPEENHHQESQKEENQKKETHQGSGNQTVSDTPQRSKEPRENPKPIPLKADDENPEEHSAKRSAFEDPRQEFKARVSERHAGTDPEYVLECLSRELSEKNLSLTEFLDFDAKCTTNPRKVTNPAGYYRDLARRLNARLEASAFAERQVLNDRMNTFLAIPDPFRTIGPKCPVCHGPEGQGVVFSSDKKSFEPCNCATAEFAAEFQAKEAARRGKAIQEAAEKEKATQAA